jgi:hypothetical protein
MELRIKVAKNARLSSMVLTGTSAKLGDGRLGHCPVVDSPLCRPRSYAMETAMFDQVRNRNFSFL